MPIRILFHSRQIYHIEHQIYSKWFSSRKYCSVHLIRLLSSISMKNIKKNSKMLKMLNIDLFYVEFSSKMCLKQNLVACFRTVAWFFLLKFINAAKFVILSRKRKKKCKFGKLILKALFSFLQIECQNTVFTCKLSKIYSTKKREATLKKQNIKKVFMRPDPGHIPKMWNIFYIPNEW